MKRGEMGHLSKHGSELSNTEPDAFTTDFHPIAPPAQPDRGSPPSPLSTMPPSNLDTLIRAVVKSFERAVRGIFAASGEKLSPR